jgi:hypothetical protein
LSAGRFRELHVQLARDAEAIDNDRLAGSDRDLLLGVQAGRQHLNERRSLAVDRIGKPEDVTRGRRDKLREPAVDVASDQDAFRAQMRLSDPAVKAASAIQLRVDDHAIAVPDRARARVHDLAGHLVAHDARIADRNRAAVDFVIRAADPAVRDTDDDVARVCLRPRHVAGDDLPRCPQDHCPQGW